MISVVIPVFNAAHFLRQCLDSVLAQTYTDMEIICVDDGSRDSSFEILEEYARRDGRIRLLQRKNTGDGAARARNLGLVHARGDYVHFLDSDDFFAPDMEERLIKKALSTGAEVTVCAADRYDNELEAITRDYSSINLTLAPSDCFSWREISDRLYQMADTVTWNKLYRRDFLVRNHLQFEPIPISDDQYVPALSLVLAGKIAVVDQKLIHYRFHTGHSQVDSYALHPDSAYLASYSIIDRLRCLGVYGDVKRSYLGTAVRLLRDYFDAMNTYDSFLYLYETYRNEVLPYYEADALPIGYFYDAKLDDWYQMLINEYPGEILFRVARAYSNETTRILRQ